MDEKNSEIGSENRFLNEGVVSIGKFLNSPQNRTGLSIWIGTAVTVLIQHFIFWHFVSDIDLFGFITGLLKIFEPENTVTTEQFQKFISDTEILFTAPTPKSLVGVASDVSGFVKAIDS